VPSTVLGPPPDDTTPSPSAIRLPVQLVEKANRIGRAERRLVRELGREPTTAEIAGATDFESDEVESIKARIAELTQP
jgi:DNA-directed RNA polymerase sigma subunit (sigma70/sigma32)